MRQHRIAFVGAGSIARAHAFALEALPYYYATTPMIERVAVVSATSESRRAFAARFGFANALDDSELWQRDDIEAVFILGPNNLHYEHLNRAVEMKGVQRIYIEKPICVTEEEEAEIAKMAIGTPGGTVIQAGFQFLQNAPVRRALRLWRELEFGKPIHFQARYLHSSYLDRSYRDKRRMRLKPTPEGGAIADLGSHAFSLLVSFLGDDLDVVAAHQGGSFPDVAAESDLCTIVMLRDSRSGAVGTVVASRISAGAGELLELEVRCAEGALRFSTDRPDHLEIYEKGEKDGWRVLNCGSEYTETNFPSRYASAGWLRSLIHAHYLFFGGADDTATVPDLNHALAVQRLVRRTAQQLSAAPHG